MDSYSVSSLQYFWEKELFIDIAGQVKEKLWKIWSLKHIVVVSKFIKNYPATRRALKAKLSFKSFWNALVIKF